MILPQQKLNGCADNNSHSFIYIHIKPNPSLDASFTFKLVGGMVSRRACLVAEEGKLSWAWFPAVQNNCELYLESFSVLVTSMHWKVR